MSVGKKTAGRQLSRACRNLPAHVNHPPQSSSHGRATPALEMRGQIQLQKNLTFSRELEAELVKQQHYPTCYSIRQKKKVKFSDLYLCFNVYHFYLIVFFKKNQNMILSRKGKWLLILAETKTHVMTYQIASQS